MFLIYLLKHTLWVHRGGSNEYPQLCFGSHAWIQKIFSEGVQIPKRDLTENFNMAKTNNLAIPWGYGPPVPPSGSAHGSKIRKIDIPLQTPFFAKQRCGLRGYLLHRGHVIL